jgi:tRNA pseudouridine38-40 synthase
VSDEVVAVEAGEERPDQTVALEIAYDGGGFAGFARQPGLTTVQGSIESALETVLRRPVQITGAGRTDAGVHALGQVVSFDAPVDLPEAPKLLRSLNALTPEGITVRSARSARAGFSARFDAISREYRYRIVTGIAPPVFSARFAWHVERDLDIDSMRRAGELLLGEHDFRSFCVTESAQGKRTVRRLDVVEVTPESVLGEDLVTVRVLGNAFLHSMVRAIVGTLVEVGSGKRQPEWVGEALEACDRSAAGPTAPAHGLTLWRVEYPQDVWL